jgi:hypothetical protein
MEYLELMIKNWIFKILQINYFTFFGKAACFLGACTLCKLRKQVPDKIRSLSVCIVGASSCPGS